MQFLDNQKNSVHQNAAFSLTANKTALNLEHITMVKNYVIYVIVLAPQFF
jgi:hypothetical protein